MADENLLVGQFNLEGLMQDFWNWSPPEHDEAGRQTKRTFQSNLIDKVANQEMAITLARENQAIATGAMKTAASLELANQKEIMADENAYGLQKMGTEYDYQQQFASDEANRQNYSDSLRADLQQNQTMLEGDENRLNMQEQGYQDRKLQGQSLESQERQLQISGDQERKTQTDMLESQEWQLDQNLRSSEKQLLDQGDIDKEVQSMRDQSSLDQIRDSGRETRATDSNRIEAQGFADRALESLSQNRIERQGEQDRENMRQSTREDDKKAKRENRYASGLTSKF